MSNRLSNTGVATGIVLVVCVAIFSLIGVVHIWKDVSIEMLTKDPVAVADLPAYTGFVSQLGIFIWAATAAVCLFTFAIQQRALKRSGGSFLLASGLLTFALGFDDAFLLHEQVLPGFGVDQYVVMVGYMVLVLCYLGYFFRQIWRTDYWLLACALAFFACSVAIDWWDPQIDRSTLFLFEDGAKLIGLVCWAVYFLRLSGSAFGNSSLLAGSASDEARWAARQA